MLWLPPSIFLICMLDHYPAGLKAGTPWLVIVTPSWPKGAPACTQARQPGVQRFAAETALRSGGGFWRWCVPHPQQRSPGCQIRLAGLTAVRTTLLVPQMACWLKSASLQKLYGGVPAVWERGASLNERADGLAGAWPTPLAAA